MGNLFARDAFFFVDDEIVKRLPKLLEEWNQIFLPQRNGIEIIFQTRREIIVHVLLKVFGEETNNNPGNVGWQKPLGIHFDIFAVLERHDDVGVGRRAAYSVFFERLHEACFCKTRWWLREMLFRSQNIQIDYVAHTNFRQQPVSVIVLRVVFSFVIDRHEARFHEHRAIGSEAMLFVCRSRICFTWRKFQSDCVKYSGDHLTRHRSPPNEGIKF